MKVANVDRDLKGEIQMPSLKEKIAAAQDALNEVAIAAAVPQPLAGTVYPPKALDVLKMLDNWAGNLGGGHEEVKKLWAVFAALRGPDSNDDKYSTTAIIRARALPNFAASAGMDVSSTAKADDQMMERLAMYNPMYSSHFGSHIRAAARALLDRHPNG
jgi:hypothetical protein